MPCHDQSGLLPLSKSLDWGSLCLPFALPWWLVREEHVLRTRQYWDATRYVEYLYGCVAETIRRDLREELGFLAVFDQALTEVMNIVDMPDRRASLLIRFILQNRGTLSKNKRGKEFPELTNEEVLSIESAIREISESINQ
ncbi:MAG: hypothetical protein ABL952_08000 [Pyrinomonadaceae bacterium]